MSTDEDEQEGQSENPDYDAGDRKKVRARHRKRRITREDELNQLRVILSTEGGRSVMWRLLEQCGVYHSPVTHPQETFREIGRSDIGRWMLTEFFEANPDAYTMMRKEAKNRDDNS